MMTYIDNKLFAYIQNKKDLTLDISKRYENSLIFIGDEQQIYNPLTNTYIGIGMSSYINTRDFILNTIDKNRKEIYISLNKDNDNNTYYIPIINGTNANYYNAYVSSTVGINPNTGSFIGNLNGIADEAKLAQIAKLSDKTHLIYINETNSDNSYYVSLFNTKNSYSYAYINNSLKYNPNTQTLETLYFKGSLKGNADTSTQSINSINSINTSYFNVSDKQGTYTLVFSSGTYGNVSAYISNNLKYNSINETLSTIYLSITESVTAKELIGQLDPSKQWGTI